MSYFTLVIHHDQAAEPVRQLKDLPRQRITEVYRFQILVQIPGADVNTEVDAQLHQWRNRFARAVLGGTSAAQVYAEDYLIQ
jgi:hypothetical protein